MFVWKSSVAFILPKIENNRSKQKDVFFSLLNNIFLVISALCSQRIFVFPEDMCQMLPRSDQMSLSDEKIKNILGHGKYDFAA